MESDKDQLAGTIERILFQSTESGFSVLILKTPKEKITVKGALQGIHPGEHVNLTGQWVMHPKFGKQFSVDSYNTAAPTNIIGIKKYLSSGLIKGIGPAYAEKLTDYFGTDVLRVIEEEPKRLLSVPGIGKGRMEKIINAWDDQKEISSIMIFLQEHGVSTTYALKIYKKYGNNARAVVLENPYRLADEIWGIGFKSADQIAQNIGISPDSVKRVRAGVLYALAQNSNNGHLYAQVEDIKKLTCKLLELAPDTIATQLKTALSELYHQEKIKLISHDDRHYIAPAVCYHTEKSVAQKIDLLQNYPQKLEFNIAQIYEQLRIATAPNDIQLNEAQQQGILSCLQNKISIITGGPGTGKTTLIKKLLTVLEKQNILYQLTAPTGRAAKRMQEGTGRRAVTIHRLLEYDFHTGGFVHNESNALKCQFLIVDEASMIDIFLANALLKAMPHYVHIVFIGDIDQLPSVGAGNFLNDLIASKIIACTRLNQVFRQAKNSMIIVNAHRVNTGEFPTSALPDAQKDFFYIKENDPTNMIFHLEKIIKTILPQYRIPIDDTVVLTPMNRGGAGTQKLNADLQKLLNPNDTDKKVMFRGITFKVGDRVMQIRNNYDKNVYNGDMGFITNIDKKEQMLYVSIDNRIIDYNFAELDELVLSYAITIHKSQGSEYPAVVIPIFTQHFTLLKRNLIYTAITRAKKLCILIGQTKAIAMAINNKKGTLRTTFLQQFLTSDLSCR